MDNAFSHHQILLNHLIKDVKNGKTEFAQNALLDGSLMKIKFVLKSTMTVELTNLMENAQDAILDMI
jgi:hypothetical protein